MNNISYLPILVSAVVAFGISSLWYSPILFGKEWLALQKISNTDLANFKERGVWKSYIAQFVMTLITFAVLAFIISLVAVRSGTDGAFIGILAWLGFVLPSALSKILWKGESSILVAIESANDLITLVIGGAIIGAWR